VTLSPLFYSVFLLPLAGPGMAVALLLAASSGRRRLVPGLILALGLLLPTFLLAQCLLSAAGWCVRPIDPGHPGPLYVPWYAELLLAPVCYLYFRVLTSAPLRPGQGWRHLLPGLGQIGLFAGVAVLGLGYRHGLDAARYGAVGAAGALLGHVVAPLALVCYVSLLLYGFRTLSDYQRYRLYLDTNFSGSERRRFISQRPLLLVLIVGFGLGLSFVALEAWFGPFAYSEIWYAFVVRGGLVFGLAVVGLQSSYAASFSHLPPAGPVRLVVGAPRVAFGQASVASPVVSEPARIVVEAPEDSMGASTTTPGVAEARAELPPELLPELLMLRRRLQAYMADERPYLEPELTLTELAQRLHSNTSILSKVINTGCGQNFNDFVNTYRVAEARRKLADPRFAHYSLVGVALESGFNSKSTFNRVFKKLTGQAPSEVVRPVM
jgi:AraC-like DNA-binding protein